MNNKIMNNKIYTDLVDKGNFPDDPKVPLDEGFKDERGAIQNLLLSPIGSVAVIDSKAGTVRSNHWHRENWHYLYVLSGSMKYLEKNVDGSDLKEIMCKAGDLIFTGPNKIHRTEFLEDTILLSFGKTPKDHENHEKDLVRVDWE